MSLDFTLCETIYTDIYSRNITHNLNKMAKEAGIYLALWRPSEDGFVFAEDIIPVLEKGLKDMKERPEHYKKFNSPNGWGTYKHFVPFVEEILKACKENPTAKIEVDI